MAVTPRVSKEQWDALDAAREVLHSSDKVLAKMDALLAESPGLVDYIVRFRKPHTFMRSQVFRVADEAAAVQIALDSVSTGNWQGWSIVDVATVEEAKARLGGSR